MKLLRIVPDDTKFRFMRFRHVSFPFSAVLSILSVLFFLVYGMNVGIDFKGGTVVEMAPLAGKSLDIADIRARVDKLDLGGHELQEIRENPNAPAGIQLRVELQSDGEVGQKRVIERIQNEFKVHTEVEYRKIETVGPRIADELVRDGTLGILAALVAVLIYLWFRFEWQFAVGAIIATMHDLVLTVGFFAISRLSFDNTSIAAILTIIGYSLNDTVVVYDRIREMMRKYKKMSTEDMIDIAINSTLSRTIVTSLTTTLALIALSIFGGEGIRSFCLAMLFGVVIGTYSSIFIAAPILIYLGAKFTQDERAVDGERAKPVAAKSTKAVGKTAAAKAGPAKA
jgi:preprotein translocase subunit SecF